MTSRRLLDFCLLACSLLAGALLAATERMGTAPAWAGLLALFPLFVAIRLHRPTVAFCCGAAWGGAACAFQWLLGVGWPDGFPALLVLVPALYAGLGSALTHWIGFSPFVLGVAWFILEAAIGATGAAPRLAGHLENEIEWVIPIAQACGYALLDALAAFICAALVQTVARLAIFASGRGRHIASGSFVRTLALAVQTWSAEKLWTLGPRGPPRPNGATCPAS